jgi:mannose/cellobiose epimerase-like protein (N-acyl-D-glucosamine 2-epimerase family)
MSHLPSQPSAGSRVDLAWFRRHLLDEILPHWEASITPQGLFLSHFDRQWRPLHKNFGTLVSQSRLLFNFAKGYELTQAQKYRDAVEAGARYLLDHFLDREHGGWFWSCNLDGQVQDTTKNSYGHAFVIFGLAHACICTGNQEFKQAALDTWEVFTTRFRDRHGGFVLLADREFRETQDVKSQNPIMHLFEALLALGDVPGMAEMHREAEGVGNFVLTHLVRKQDKWLPEVYTRDWQEQPGAAQRDASGLASRDGRIDIGHAFEWAFLLSTAVERGLPAHYLEHGRDFIDYGMRLGYDAEQGGVFSPTSSEGKLYHRRKGWWEQTEATRALMHYALLRKEERFLTPLHQTIRYIQEEFVDPDYGGWYQHREAGDNPATQDKGNEWKLDYHVVGMCMEAIRLSQTPRGGQK